MKVKAYIVKASNGFTVAIFDNRYLEDATECASKVSGRTLSSCEVDVVHPINEQTILLPLGTKVI